MSFIFLRFMFSDTYERRLLLSSEIAVEEPTAFGYHKKIRGLISATLVVTKLTCFRNRVFYSSTYDTVTAGGGVDVQPCCTSPLPPAVTVSSL
jgi:hypothetical protein